MKTGTFLYHNYRGERRFLPVRECPDPAKARMALEGLLGTSVYFQEAK